jgi:HSP20 family protein
MPKRKQQGKKLEGEAKVDFDFGLGGFFKGLGDFLDLFSDMAETGESEVTRSGEFKVKGLGDKARGVYGFTVRTGIGGIPRVERFGNIRPSEKGPVVADVREPLVDIFDEGQQVLLVAELPGVSEEEIHVEAQDDVLSLQTTGRLKYEKEILLPGAVDPKPLEKTFKNGILELRLKRI